ncbi:hypothetical protein T440DRAFT_250668 [Plenodomus tracheiphilus IPT5]|uniref:Uncharacterized protein n=1 Tax=Plenodomus tracheiphilus IPT5 TaxID=1408161 RepID=A0A6A7ARU5_9PLEO|nr:hypothetical protein T440DRAFT_250668 [Plenodomus tracheiphilus IPT5]
MSWIPEARTSTSSHRQVGRRHEPPTSAGACFFVHSPWQPAQGPTRRPISSISSISMTLTGTAGECNALGRTRPARWHCALGSILTCSIRQFAHGPSLGTQVAGASDPAKSSRTRWICLTPSCYAVYSRQAYMHSMLAHQPRVSSGRRPRDPPTTIAPSSTAPIRNTQMLVAS